MTTTEYLRAKDQVKIYEDRMKAIVYNINFRSELYLSSLRGFEEYKYNSKILAIGAFPVERSIFPWVQKRNFRRADEAYRKYNNDCQRSISVVEEQVKSCEQEFIKFREDSEKELKEIKKKRDALVKKMGLKEN